MDQPHPPAELATMNRDGSRRWVDPKVSAGKYHARRRWVAYGLISLFVALPLARVAGRPVVLFDLARQELHLFGMTFFANEVALLTLLLLSVFIGIFLITALFGRVWCGWACPQTVYMEWVFRPIERLFLGKGRKDSLRAKVGMYAVYTALAFVLAHVFLGYFVPLEELSRYVTESPAAHPGAFFLVMATTGLMVFDFAWFREQMCVVICPYARIQSALLDKESLIVAYDDRRGEPRSPKLKVLNEAPAGDCIDCKACVRTCPTGIDIRDGLQLECIACAQCADACDAIMTKIGRPTGLVGYSTKAKLDGKRGGSRVRILVYPALLAVLLGLLAWRLLSREELELLVLRKPGAPFAVREDGMVENKVRLRIRSLAVEPRELEIHTSAGVELKLAEQPVVLAPGKLKSVDATVWAPRSAFSGGEIRYSITAKSGDVELVRDSKLLGPVSSGGQP